MIFAEITKRNYMSVSVTLKSYFYEVLIPPSQKNTSSPIEDILHHVSKYIFYEKACALQMFQSTHPHGVRRFVVGKGTNPKGFNPRTHTGCDSALIDMIPDHIVSIHAPTRGATHPYVCCNFCHFCFNPRTHTGCDSVQSYIL